MQGIIMEILKNKIIFDAWSLKYVVDYMENGLKFIGEEGDDARIRLQKFFLNIRILKEVYNVPFELTGADEKMKIKILHLMLGALGKSFTIADIQNLLA